MPAIAEKMPVQPLAQPETVQTQQEQIDLAIRVKYAKVGFNMRIINVNGPFYRVTLVDRKTGSVGTNSYFIKINFHEGLVRIEDKTIRRSGAVGLDKAIEVLQAERDQ